MLKDLVCLHTLRNAAPGLKPRPRAAARLPVDHLPGGAYVCCKIPCVCVRVQVVEASRIRLMAAQGAGDLGDAAHLQSQPQHAEKVAMLPAATRACAGSPWTPLLSDLRPQSAQAATARHTVRERW